MLARRGTTTSKATATSATLCAASMGTGAARDIAGSHHLGRVREDYDATMRPMISHIV